MKKTFLKVVGVLALTALALVSCKQPATEYSGSVDTVLSLDTPVVSAKAYPGMNYVSWNPVRGAYDYEVSIYEDGKFYRYADPTEDYFVGNCLADTNVKNGVKYTYKVEAVSTSDPSREVVVRNSKIGEASCTAILPPVDTEAVNLAAYEGGYDGKKAKTISKDEAKKALDVTIANGNTYADDSYIRFSFNQKAYLGYAWNVVAGDKTFLTKDLFSSPSNVIYDFAVNNKTAYDNVKVTSAGKYTLAFMIASFNDEFAPSYVTFEDFFEVPLFVGSTETANVKSAWIDAGKTARVMWTPCVLEDGITLGAVSEYKVYREIENKPGALVEVSGIKADKIAGEVYYYVDDASASADLTNTYYVVYSKDGRYEATDKTDDLGAYVAISGVATNPTECTVTAVAKDADSLVNDGNAKIVLANNTTLVAAKYAVVTDEDLAKITFGDDTDLGTVDYSSLFSVDSAYVKELKFANVGDNTFEWTLDKDVADGSYFIAYFEIAEDKKNNLIFIKSSKKVDTAAVATAPTLSITPKTNEADRLSNDFDITLLLKENEEIVSVKYAYGKDKSEAEFNADTNGTEIKVTTNDYYWVDGSDAVKGYKFEIKNTELGAHYGETIAAVVEVSQANKTGKIKTYATSAIELSDDEDRIDVGLSGYDYGVDTRSVKLNRYDTLNVLKATTGGTTTYTLMDDVADYTITAEFAVVPKDIANFTEIDQWSSMKVIDASNPTADYVTSNYYTDPITEKTTVSVEKGSPVISGVYDDQWVVVKYIINYKYGIPTDEDLSKVIGKVQYAVNKN